MGKTTFCKALLAHLDDHVYAHFTRLPRRFDYYWGYATRASKLIVQDRFHLSEIVYAKARSDSSPLTPELYRLVDARVRMLGGLTVLVAADPLLVRSRWDSTQMYGREVTVEAARIFDDLPYHFPDYKIDIDHTIVCDMSNPFPTDRDVEKVLAMYHARMLNIESVLARRWYHKDAL